MILFHATPKANLDSIRENGINPAFSQGKRKAVYLHTASKRAWAILHTASRHQIPAEEVAILQVKIPRSRVTRRWRSIWTTDTSITDFTEIDAAEIDAAPLEESPRWIKSKSPMGNHIKRKPFASKRFTTFLYFQLTPPLYSRRQNFHATAAPHRATLTSGIATARFTAKETPLETE